jgi:hydrogenase maturation protease
MGRILVAGIGNVFLGDDGFGVEVARRLRDESLGNLVDVADFGIRGVHLAYELAGGTYDAAILVDAVSRGGAPGTLYAIEVDPAAEWARGDAVADAHTLTPAAVIAWVHRVGGRCQVVILGCEPETIDEAMALSPTVAASIDPAMQMVRDLVAQLSGAASCA